MQRWGNFLHPLQLSMHHCGVAICDACWLHNICISDSVCHQVQPVSIEILPGFECKTDY
jgi:hypothetical protein